MELGGARGRLLAVVGCRAEGWVWSVVSPAQPSDPAPGEITDDGECEDP